VGGDRPEGDRSVIGVRGVDLVPLAAARMPVRRREAPWDGMGWR
jgi:hypothetical protein